MHLVTIAFSAVLLVALLPCKMLAGQICVTNGATSALLFTAENHYGDRVSAMLAPNETLCVKDGTPPGGTIAAFENQTRLEGCSRLIGPAGQDTLLSYAAFDRCRWKSHDY